MKFKNYYAILGLSLLSSCSFNKVFLKPIKIPTAAAKGFSFSIPPDTVKTKIKFDGDTHQVTFSQKGKELDLGYTVENVMFKSADGNMLNGWMLKPQNQTATTTILHFHGNGGSLLNQYRAIDPLMKDGSFQIFMVDYSGFGFSEGKATRENVLTDGLSAFDYLKARPDVKDTKLIIYGQSLGGNLAAVVAKEKQQGVDGLVIEGGFSSHKDIGKSRGSFLGKLLVKEMYSSKEAVKDFHKPVLVIHSSEDEEVPFALGKKIFENANQPKEFYEIKHKHIEGPTFYGEIISEKIKGLLSKK